MNIRLANKSDGETVIHLVSELMIELGFPEFDDRDLGEIFKGLEQGGKHGFVMLTESDDTICGICSVSFVVALRTRGVYGISPYREIPQFSLILANAIHKCTHSNKSDQSAN